MPTCNVRLLLPLPGGKGVLCAAGDGTLLTLSVDMDAVVASSALPGMQAEAGAAAAAGKQQEGATAEADAAQQEETAGRGTAAGPEFVEEAGYRGHRQECMLMFSALVAEVQHVTCCRLPLHLPCTAGAAAHSGGLAALPISSPLPATQLLQGGLPISGGRSGAWLLPQRCGAAPLRQRCSSATHSRAIAVAAAAAARASRRPCSLSSMQRGMQRGAAERRGGSALHPTPAAGSAQHAQRHCQCRRHPAVHRLSGALGLQRPGVAPAAWRQRQQGSLTARAVLHSGWAHRPRAVPGPEPRWIPAVQRLA